MPIFRPRTRVEILREMVARVVARSTLVGLVRDSVIFHLLAAAADEDAEQYFQLAQVRALFSIDKATGSDLDERAAEIQPGTIRRRESLFASGEVSFFRPGIVGAQLIAAGTIVAAEDALGQIKYRTTAAATILNGNSSITGVPVVALEAGKRGNTTTGSVIVFVSRVPGLSGVSNPSAFTNGADRESDESFRARLKLHVQSLSRGTPTAIRSFALGVKLTDGRRVLFAKVVEPITPTGDYDVFIDDGTGAVDEYDEAYLTSDDYLINPAVGGEINLYTAARPIRDDGSFQLWRNVTLQVRNVDYYLNEANGQVELMVPLTAGDSVRARYRFYTGLIQETQRVVDGDPAALATYPGVRAAGTRAIVKPAVAVFQTLAASAAVKEDYDAELVLEQVEAVIMAYVNNLDIGEPVIAAEIVKRAMAVPGMFNFQITDLSGTFPAVDQLILSHQAGRLVSSNMTIS